MSNHELSAFVGHWLPKLEDEMRAVLQHDEAALATHYGMLHYHLGWVDEQLRPQNFPAGKRLRPMLCLLACAEVGGDPGQALAAGAALEILHNFSLIHDDIEDGDELRRHRPTVWKVWGVPQAINAGDAMFTLAFAAMQRLARRGVSAETTLQALARFTQTCLDLTEGQHLDIGFEQRGDVTVAEYMRMIQGKTAALVGASVAIGALIGGATAAQANALQEFGCAVGLAFQIQDDILGIWGDPAVTGKAAGNDILRRKKSLPMLHALNHERIGEHFETLLADNLGPTQLPQALLLLGQAGTRSFAEAQMQAQHDAGVNALRTALGERYVDSTLFALAEGLLNRKA
jgi:geranylgeranyl diphosphate synthase type I